jgi:hypothetical protein
MAKNKNNPPQIQGEFFNPVFMSEEEFEEGYKKSQFWTDSNFYEEYRKHIVAMSHISECAKIYIIKNWKSVKDWAGLNIKITHGPTGKVTEYYNHDLMVQKRERRKKEAEEKAKKEGREIRRIAFDDFLDKFEKENKEKHNPILEFTEVIFDPTDGDFSVTINGNKEHWWIKDEEIIIIADYIEKTIKNEEAKLSK